MDTPQSNNFSDLSRLKSNKFVKNGSENKTMTIGVARALIRQPKCFKTLVPANITINVEAPTIELKFPMNLHNPRQK